MATFINLTKHPITPLNVNKGIGAEWSDLIATWSDTFYSWTDVDTILNVTKYPITPSNLAKN